MKHTELPLIIVNSYGQNEQGCYDLISNPDSDTFIYVGEINKKGDAGFIVKACNNHYQLLSLIKEIDAAFNDGEYDGGDIIESLKIKVKEAIKQAEES